MEEVFFTWSMYFVFIHQTSVDVIFTGLDKVREKYLPKKHTKDKLKLPQNNIWEVN